MRIIKNFDLVKLNDFLKKVLNQKSAIINGLFLLIIIAIGFLIRITGIAKGLPYLHHVDEPHIASRALLMLKNGVYNPHWFQYPSLMTYVNFVVDIFHFLKLAGAGTIKTLADIKLINPSELHHGVNVWTVSHPSFFLWNRVVTAIMGTACIYYTYLIGKEVTGKNLVGLTAGALIATSATMIYHSRFITPNIPGVLLVLGTVYYAIRFNSTKNKYNLLWSLIFTGLAIGTKYNYGICLIIPLSIYWINREQFKTHIITGTIVCVIIAIGTFFAVNPFVILDLPQFLADIGKQIHHYKTGHGSHTIEPGFTHLSYQISEFTKDFGPLLMILAAIGAFFSFKHKNGWLPVLFVTIYMAYMVRQKVDFHRNFIGVYPFIALWIAITIDALSDYIPMLREKFKFAVKNKLFKWVLNNSLFIILFLFIVSFSNVEYRKAKRRANHVETRSRMVDALNELTQNAYKNIAISEELLVHREDLERINGNVKIIPHMSFMKNAEQYDYFVSTKFGSGRINLAEKDSIFNTAYADREIIKTINGRTMKLFGPTGDPIVYIYGGEPLTAENLSVASFPVKKYNKLSQKYGEDIYVGGRSGRYSSGKLIIKPGTYILKADLMGNVVNGETAIIKIYVGSKEIKEITTTREFSEVEMQFKVNTLSRTEISMLFINDYNGGSSDTDRNFYIRNISIKAVD